VLQLGEGPLDQIALPLDNARTKFTQKTFIPDEVTLRHVATTPAAIMEHRGDPTTLGATIQRFIAWRKAAGLHPKTSPTFNVWRSEPRAAVGWAEQPVGKVTNSPGNE
jgi:AraC family transcriptional regulator